ncbi:hypothetical protein AUV08_08730 [Micrococcus sp. CH7]|nr:hypothetical protein AUV08_08730 [Micrococcus sp. CH7]
MYREVDWARPVGAAVPDHAEATAWAAKNAPVTSTRAGTSTAGCGTDVRATPAAMAAVAPARTGSRPTRAASRPARGDDHVPAR